MAQIDQITKPKNNPPNPNMPGVTATSQRAVLHPLLSMHAPQMAKHIESNIEIGQYTPAITIIKPNQVSSGAIVLTAQLAEKRHFTTRDA